MSVLKNLKSLFIEDDNTSPKKEKPAPKDATPPKPPKGGDDFVKPSPKEVETSGNVDEKIVNTLFQAIEQNNLKGFDYLEFKQAVQGLKKMVADEATRFKSAFATASTMGITMDKLVDSANYYVSILDKEKSQFIKAANDQSNRLVGDRKKELDHLMKSLADKKRMIDQLQQELSKGEERIKVIQDGIENSTIKIENTKRNFEASWGHLKKQMLNDIEKIKTYLK